MDVVRMSPVNARTGHASADNPASLDAYSIWDYSVLSFKWSRRWASLVGSVVDCCVGGVSNACPEPRIGGAVPDS
jgi:hypothetical protein